MALQDTSDSPPEIANFFVDDDFPRRVGDGEQGLKYLEGVQAASLHAISCVSNLYEYVKEKSGPLKPGVQSVEGTVKSVVGPAYDKFHDVPSEVLKLVDRKMDESVTGLKQRVPASVKEAATAAQNAPAAVRSAASEVRKINVTETASGYAKELYTKCEPAAEQYAASAWRKVNQLPGFPKVAEAVIPTAASCAEIYNQTVESTAEKGYKISSYLPFVPTEKIAKVFSSPDVASVEPPTAATSLVESSSST